MVLSDGGKTFMIEIPYDKKDPRGINIEFN